MALNGWEPGLLDILQCVGPSHRMRHCPVSYMIPKVPVDIHVRQNLFMISELESIFILHINTKHFFGMVLYTLNFPGM